MPIADKARFPRLPGHGETDEIILKFIELRKKYPAPEYNWRGGAWNPGDYLPAWSMKQNTEHLQALCEKHSLKSEGSRWKLIKRLYLHWRASRLKTIEKGFEFYGYGEGFENIQIPSCHCGNQRVPKRFPRLAKMTMDYNARTDDQGSPNKL